MIKVTFEIDNKTAHCCSPLTFLKKFVLLEATDISEEFPNMPKVAIYDTPYARIKVNKIEQS